MSVEKAVGADIDQHLLLEMFRKIVLIREFEERVYYLFLEGKMPGTVHLAAGQEAVAVGACAALRQTDIITSTHRAHGHMLAKGVSVRGIMAELFGRASGTNKGKGGSMHVGDIRVGALTAIPVVGGALPVAAGLALAQKRRGDGVVLSFFGDGATNSGAFHEATNIAAVWSLPLVLVCENNLYGASTHFTKTMRISTIAERAAAYGIPGVLVENGNDVVAVYEAVRSAVVQARAGKGPTLLECRTYRKRGHSRRDPAQYRPSEEVAFWEQLDAVQLARQRLLSDGLSPEELDRIVEEAQRQIADSVEFSETSPWPDVEDVTKDVFTEEDAKWPA